MNKTVLQIDTMEQLIQEYLANYKDLPYGIALLKNDQFSTLAQANSAFYEIIGHTKEQFLENHQNHIAEILIDDICDRSVQNPEVVEFDNAFDLRIRAADGSVRWVHGFTRYNVQSDVFFLTIADMTDKLVKATVDLSFDAFQARNEVLTYVSKYTSECVAVSDVETDEVIYMNPATMKLAGMEQESQWHGKTYAEIAFGAKENIPSRYYEPLTEEFTTREYYNKFHKIYVNTKRKYIGIPNLNHKMRLTIITDITAQKQLEHKIAVQNVLHNCMETLFTVEVSDKSPDEAYYDILNQLKSYYQSDVTFFYKFKNGTNELENIYEAFGDTITPAVHTFPIVVPERHMKFLQKASNIQVDENYSIWDYLDMDDVTSLRRLYAAHHVDDLACVSVYNKQGQLAACMGVTNSKVNENDKEPMELLSRFICMFLEHENDQSIKEEAVALEAASRANVTEICMKNVQNVTNPSESITEILDAICLHYDADFAVTLLNRANGTCVTAYAGGQTIPDLAGLDNQPRHIMDTWIEVFAKFPKTASNVDFVDPIGVMVKQLLLEKYGIYNFIVSPIKNTSGTPIGLLFVNNFKLTNRNHLSVYMVAESISHYLGKHQLYEATQLGLLTRLPNKTTAQNQIAQLLEQGKDGALFIIDIDNFKQLNDSFGHHAGDQAIVDLADTLKQIFKPTDIVSRIGGDEFLVFTPGLASRDAIATLANQILAKCYHRYEKDGVSISISASIGICRVNEKLKTFQPLYENADYALYVAKKNGKHRYQMYSEVEYQEDASVVDEMRFYPNVVEKLQTAIHDHSFVVHYQPIHHASTGTYTQAEALVRIAKPDGSLIYPNDFIQVAENSGLVVEMTYQILEQVCRDFRTLLNGNPHTTLDSIAINVPYLQFTDPDMERRFLKILKKYEIAPNQIKLEITERSVINDMDLMMNKMTSLKALGFTFELDDFGTNYSNLQMCITLPLEIIKLDRSLLLAAFESERNRHFFEHIIAGIHHAQAQIILEGVENQEQLVWATSCHCEHIQGYYFSKPVDFEHFYQCLQTR